jgi:hypothetical protein
LSGAAHRLKINAILDNWKPRQRDVPTTLRTARVCSSRVLSVTPQRSSTLGSIDASGA